MNSAGTNAGGKVILLVEDNPDDEALTVRALEKHRVANRVEVARDGVEALDWLFRQGKHAGRPAEDPSLVLLDLKLPKIDGLEVLKRMRAEPSTRRIPVVALTSSREEPDVRRAYDLGVNSYVVKPVDFNSFLDATGRLGLYWLLLNQAPAP
jgi:two-component system response regulator